MKIKTISTILSLVITAMSISSLAANAAGEVKLRLTAENDMTARGEEFTYTVSLSDPEKIRGIQMGLNYDADRLEIKDYGFVDSATENAYVYEINAADGRAAFAVTYENPEQIEGAVAVYTFRVKEDAASGPLNFSLTENGALITSESGDLLEAQTELDSVSVRYDYNADVKASTDSAVVYNGSEVIYKIELSELAGMRGLSAVVGYDDTLLTLVSAKAKGSLNNNVYTDTVIKTENEGEIDIAAVYRNPADIGGTIASLRFKINDNQPAGEYRPISLKDFKAVDAEGKDADINISFEADPINVSRASIIEMSYKADKTEVKQGDIVAYSISLDRIAKSRGFQAALNYDADILTPIACEKGDVLVNAGFASEINIDTPGIIGIACAYDSEKVETGLVGTIFFEVSQSAADGYAAISASDTLAVDDGYSYVDAESVNNIDPVYIGRLPREYNLALSTDKAAYMSDGVVYLTADVGTVSKFMGIQFTISFDTTKLEYIVPESAADYYGSVMRSAATKSINTSKVSDGRVEIIAAYGANSPYSGSGDLCRLAFKVVSGDSGNADFNVVKVTPSTGDTCETTSAKIFISYRAVSDTIAKIDEISDTITVADEASIRTARDLFDALSDEEQAQVTNADKLIAAESAFSEIKERIYAVILKIDSIGEVTLSSKAAIESARAAYELLTDDEKARVNNYETLTSAEDKYYELLPKYEYSYTDDGASVEVTVKNNKSESDIPVLITAQYDETGALLSVNWKKIEIEKGSYTTYSYTKAQNSASVKLMLWYGIDTMQPYQN